MLNNINTEKSKEKERILDNKYKIKENVYSFQTIYIKHKIKNYKHQLKNLEDERSYSHGGYNYRYYYQRIADIRKRIDILYTQLNNLNLAIYKFQPYFAVNLGNDKTIILYLDDNDNILKLDNGEVFEINVYNIYEIYEILTNISFFGDDTNYFISKGEGLFKFNKHNKTLKRIRTKEGYDIIRFYENKKYNLIKIDIKESETEKRSNIHSLFDVFIDKDLNVHFYVKDTNISLEKKNIVLGEDRYKSCFIIDGFYIRKIKRNNDYDYVLEINNINPFQFMIALKDGPEKLELNFFASLKESNGNNEFKTESFTRYIPIDTNIIKEAINNLERVGAGSVGIHTFVVEYNKKYNGFLNFFGKSSKDKSSKQLNKYNLIFLDKIKLEDTYFLKVYDVCIKKYTYIEKGKEKEYLQKELWFDNIGDIYKEGNMYYFDGENQEVRMQYKLKYILDKDLRETIKKASEIVNKAKEIKEEEKKIQQELEEIAKLRQELNEREQRLIEAQQRIEENVEFITKTHKETIKKQVKAQMEVSEYLKKSG